MICILTIVFSLEGVRMRPVDKKRALSKWGKNEEGVGRRKSWTCLPIFENGQVPPLWGGTISFLIVSRPHQNQIPRHKSEKDKKERKE